MATHRFTVTLVAAFLSACAPWPVEVTPALNGVVQDGGKGVPITGATVEILEFPESRVITGKDGIFSIHAIRKWQVVVLGTDARPAYQLAVEAQGYESKIQVWYVGDDRLQRIELQRKELN